jgi:hypothetical protein
MVQPSLSRATVNSCGTCCVLVTEVCITEETTNEKWQLTLKTLYTYFYKHISMGESESGNILTVHPVSAGCDRGNVG